VVEEEVICEILVCVGFVLEKKQVRAKYLELKKRVGKIKYLMDTIGNFLTQIRNSLIAKKSLARDRYSRINLAIAKILKEEGYVGEIKKIDADKKNFLEIELKYNDSGEPLIQSVKRISSPGKHFYVNYKKIPRVKPLAGYKEELGIVIISTSKGLMTGKEARRRHLGGELIAEIY